ncbi:MAG: exonuclease SbcCD subunit D [Elusimicrobiales bacterium]|nr:exonuclease SbcCD subunit D [Elusimicrobiales bacterium]
MRIMHLSDLHIGKKIHGFSMLADQKYILDRICEIARNQKPQAVIIAGDIYDQSVPSAEAVSMFDIFLAEMSKIADHIFIISGNHDSAERIAFGHKIMSKSGVHLSPVFDGNVRPMELEDEYGKICFYMLPFIMLHEARQIFAQAAKENNPENPELPEIKSYNDIAITAVSRMEVNRECRNVLITHQFVTGAKECESEDIISVGGADNVNADVFEPFDYVALGHLHGPQHIERDSIRYCGTPLKYSFSEKDHKKTLTMLEIGRKNAGEYAEIKINEIPLVPLHDMREIKGKYDELMLRENYINTNKEDYLHIILTDENDVPDGMARLRSVYPNAMLLDYDNQRTKNIPGLQQLAASRSKSGLQLLEELYKMINGSEMDGNQIEFAKEIFDDIGKDHQEGK